MGLVGPSPLRLIGRFALWAIRSRCERRQRSGMGSPGPAALPPAKHRNLGLPWGIRKPYGEVGWFVATSIYNIVKHFEYWGVYYPDPEEIVIVHNQPLEQLEHTVKHEILHHLIQNTDHDEKTFVRCLPQNPDH